MSGNSLFPSFPKTAGKGYQDINRIHVVIPHSIIRQSDYIYLQVYSFVIHHRKILNVLNHILHLKWGVPKVKLGSTTQKKVNHIFGQLNHFEFFAKKFVENDEK